MRSFNNTVPEVVARYARNRHRAEFVAANPGIPEEVLAVVYFRRATNGKWWYAPAKRINFDHEPPRWEGCPEDAKWYEIPVCPIKVGRITQETREKYADLLQDVQS